MVLWLLIFPEGSVSSGPSFDDRSTSFPPCFCPCCVSESRCCSGLMHIDILGTQRQMLLESQRSYFPSDSQWALNSSLYFIFPDGKHFFEHLIPHLCRLKYYKFWFRAGQLHVTTHLLLFNFTWPEACLPTSSPLVAFSHFPQFFRFLHCLMTVFWT